MSKNGKHFARGYVVVCREDLVKFIIIELWRYPPQNPHFFSKFAPTMFASLF